MEAYVIVLLCAALPTVPSLTTTSDMNDTKDTKEPSREVVILKNFQMECVEETKVDPDLVIRFKSGDWRNVKPALKKWVLCILLKMGLMSPEGVYKFDEALARLGKRDKTLAEKIIDECLSTNAIPAEDIAWKYVHCLHVKDPLGNFSSISILTP